jgi:hypothetical protein
MIVGLIPDVSDGFWSAAASNVRASYVELIEIKRMRPQQDEDVQETKIGSTLRSIPRSLSSKLLTSKLLAVSP